MKRHLIEVPKEPLTFTRNYAASGGGETPKRLEIETTVHPTECFHNKVAFVVYCLNTEVYRSEHFHVAIAEYNKI